MDKPKLKKLWQNFVDNANKAAQKKGVTNEFSIKTDYSKPKLSKLDVASIIATVLFIAYIGFNVFIKYLQN
ncbi:hypothetical protein [Vibrio crassostreae]|uniref:hypothetical protein n=1 Tax=Vibrio crassostreae TaxID=246167 RepID=UPI001B30D0EB|nr:hypothetical protein [Vibrio crassostreae]